MYMDEQTLTKGQPIEIIKEMSDEMCCLWPC
jgi:hypothetical protein